jgi:ABC-type glycerol-3-phosphate transport system substrate-binding protein
MKRLSVLAGVLYLAAVLTGCGAQQPPNSESKAGASSTSQASATPAPAASPFTAIDATAAVFWDRQTNETAKLIEEMIAGFNTGRTGLPVKRDFIGGYTEIFRKVTLGIQAHKLPSMAVAYESMTAEYVNAGAAAPLDGFIADPKTGIAPEDLDDFFPAVLDTNRLNGKMYSFPFCKSVLMMYFNKKVLADAGFSQPPKTWDEFLAQARQIKAKTGKRAWAVSVDTSTIDGMIFSMGGDVIKDKTTLFDSPESIKVFELFETLAKEDLAIQIPPTTYDDETEFSQDQVAFIFRSSSGKSSVNLLMVNRQDQWGMANVPQADPAHPHTVLYGPNVVIFNTTPDQQTAAWDFAKFFTSKEQSTRWALGTGYMPIRKSSAQDPKIQAMWGEWEYNRAAYDCLAFAKPEPNVPGWQEVRNLVDKAQTSVLTGLKSGKDAATELKKAADLALSKK